MGRSGRQGNGTTRKCTCPVCSGPQALLHGEGHPCVGGRGCGSALDGATSRVLPLPLPTVQLRPDEPQSLVQCCHFQPWLPACHLPVSCLGASPWQRAFQLHCISFLCVFLFLSFLSEFPPWSGNTKKHCFLQAGFPVPLGVMGTELLGPGGGRGSWVGRGGCHSQQGPGRRGTAFPGAR